MAKIEVYRPRTLAGAYLAACLGGLYSLAAPPLAAASLASAGLLFLLGLAAAITRKGPRQTFQVLCGLALFWWRSHSSLAKELLAQAASHERQPLLIALWAGFFMTTLFCVRREPATDGDVRRSDAPSSLEELPRPSR